MTFSRAPAWLSYSTPSCEHRACFLNICIKLCLDLRSKPKGINGGCTEGINNDQTDNECSLVGNEAKRPFRYHQQQYKVPNIFWI